VERRADATLPDGRKLGLGGFKIVDTEKLLALPDEKVLAWHKAGWLALVHGHLASLDRFQALLQRQGSRGGPVDEPSSEAAEAAEPAPILQ
jgi:hypothetical protein